MEFKKNTEEKKFTLTKDDHTAYITYDQVKPSRILLRHIELPKELQGRGIAKKLTTLTLDYIREQNYDLITVCPYIKNYINENPEYKTLLFDHQKK